MVWTEKSLREAVRSQIGEALFVVVSNREPYLHIFREERIEWQRPASGMVTALDPVMRACGGLWVAHGSGNADKEVVDERDRVGIPPDRSLYTLKRVWLTKEEEDGYYHGFANETLWPLCHVVFARPTFDPSDWLYYQKVNEKFAQAVLAEIGEQKAFVWIQDYHFALLPKFLKETRPDLLIAHFWHIPWPNPEVFRICPWKHDLLWGLLENDLIGFHLRYHCNNFLDTVERELEVRVDRERSSVFHHGGRETLVRPFPISVDFAQLSREAQSPEVEREMGRIKTSYALHNKLIGLGVDRIDYTKGIPERLRAVDRFLQENPAYRGRFVFLQMGPLSRIHIKRYKDLNDELNALVEEINWKHASKLWSPIILVRRHLTYPEILALYRLADLCVVSSLHDGMNLVAKEYLAARNDLRGMLLLSCFTGSARELPEAVLINPYDSEGFAEAIKATLEMPAEERSQRMQKMRETVAQNNIYRWAGKVISTLTRLI